MNRVIEPAAYQRRWRNLLINKRYQLRFTLFMVGLSTVLMVGLGIWVMKVADEATEVGKISVRGTPCPAIPDLVAHAETAPAEVDGPATPKPDPRPIASPGPAGATPRRRAAVTLDPSSIMLVEPGAPPPAVRANFGLQVVARWTCERWRDGAVDDLERGRRRILWVLIATGLVLALGLAAYGLKMTHQVAGPLFKVGLYLGKMRDGRFDKVYDLRKGDQLVDFYEHFKRAHAGVVKMEQDDIDRLTAVIVAAVAAGAGAEPATAELRELLARKEKSIA